MTELIGKILLFAVCLWIGGDRCRRRKKRVACLRAFRQAIADLGRELTFSLSPLDSLMERVGEGNRYLVPFFDTCCETFRRNGGESWADSWHAAANTVELPLSPADRDLLSRAGDILGRWDGETQRTALAELLSRLDETIFDGAGEEKRLFRVDLALGFTAGVFCILLL